MKANIISIGIALTLIIGAVILVPNKPNTEEEFVNNVSIVDGVQIIEITAKGGYQPRVSQAKAGIPTIIRFNTKGTFDCSLAVTIPSLGISKALPQSGVTDISIPDQELGTLQGTCGMGMYPFEVEFSS